MRNFVCLQNLVPQVNAKRKPSSLETAAKQKAEYPAFLDLSLRVIRTLSDKLLICASRLFELGNTFKARIELSGENALRWSRVTLNLKPRERYYKRYKANKIRTSE